jgi:DNA mismatch endonuclease (patch repair protein)
MKRSDPKPSPHKEFPVLGRAPMVDVFSKSKRSRIMASIRSMDTKPEIILRAFLRQSGIRIRLHLSALPGTPDITVQECRAAIFVNGCFWHAHKGCKRAGLPATRQAFWRRKITTNSRRDRRNATMLRHLGWHVFTIWQCQLTPGKVKRQLNSLLTRIQRLPTGQKLRKK